MTKALTTRKNNEKAAVALSPDEDKKDAIKLSVETYRSQTKNAQNLLVQARKEAWQTFENDIKKCRELQVDSLDAIKEENYGSQKKAEVNEAKSIKDTLKSQFENLKSLFN